MSRTNLVNLCDYNRSRAKVKDEKVHDPKKMFKCPFCNKKHYDSENILQGICSNTIDNNVKVKCNCLKSFGVTYYEGMPVGYKLEKLELIDRKAILLNVTGFVLPVDGTRECEGRCKSVKSLTAFEAGNKKCIECSKQQDKERKAARQKEKAIYSIM